MTQRRDPRKKGQHRKSSKHSDLYTDEDPKRTIHGLGFKDSATARKSISKIKKSGHKHSHKVQAALVMKQRAKVAKDRTKDPEKKKNIKAAYNLWSNELEKLKNKTEKMRESQIAECIREFVTEVMLEAVYCRICGNATDGSHDTCEEHREEPTKLELLGNSNFEHSEGTTVYKGPYRNGGGRPSKMGWRGF